jgi:4-hydroxy-tetrahydrodipicolinate synthase
MMGATSILAIVACMSNYTAGLETRFRGIYPMMYALFDANGRIDEKAMRLQVSACVAGRAHGIAVLGLATEVSKLTPEERRLLVHIVLDEVSERVPVAVTVSESSAQAQAQFANWAAEHGASWVILQPPPQRGMEESWYAEFFADVMRRTELPCAIQNAPEYIGIGLTPAAIRQLAQTCPNFVLLKGEGPVLSIRAVIEAVEGRLAVFNGRGGLELPDNLRAGCAGMIPACDTFDYQVQVYEAMSQGDAARAEDVYSRILPAIVFTLQSLDTLICYGKRIGAMRLGLTEVYDRAPALAPTQFGLACAKRYAALLGPLTSAR